MTKHINVEDNTRPVPNMVTNKHYNKITNYVIKWLSDHGCGDLDQLNLDISAASIGLDSLDVCELAMDLEDTFKITLEDKLIAPATTIIIIINHAATKLTAKTTMVTTK